MAQLYLVAWLQISPVPSCGVLEITLTLAPVHLSLKLCLISVWFPLGVHHVDTAMFDTVPHLQMLTLR